MTSDGILLLTRPLLSVEEEVFDADNEDGAVMDQDDKTFTSKVR